MITRYSLLQDPAHWSGDIQEDHQGAWVRWKAVEDYIAFAEAHGYTPEPEQLDLYVSPEVMVEKDILPEELDEFDELELPLDNGEDIYDLMVGKTRYKDDIDD